MTSTKLSWMLLLAGCALVGPVSAQGLDADNPKTVESATDGDDVGDDDSATIEWTAGAPAAPGAVQPLQKKVIVVPLPMKMAPLPKEIEKPRTDPLDKRPGNLVRMKIHVDRPVEGEEAQLQHYMLPFLGKEATGELAQQAEKRIMSIGRYRAAVCRYNAVGKKGAKELVCGATRFVTIRSLELEGVPWTFLEEEVRRRVFLRPGEILEKRDESGKSRIGRQKVRLERFLERKGLRGAKVRIQSPPVADSSDVEVKVRIDGGEFAQVRQVTVHNAAPFSSKELHDTFARMCVGDGFLEGFEMWSLACFSKERLRSVVKATEQKLVKAGYPQARVKVKTTWHDPMQTPHEECRLTGRQQERNEGALPSICVDLDVTLQLGPHLVVRLFIEDDDGNVVQQQRRPDIFWHPRWTALGEGIGGAARGIPEFMSRFVQHNVNLPLTAAWETSVSMKELEDALTFSSARSAQPAEVGLSAIRLKEVLAQHGYTQASIRPVVRQVPPNRVEVDFHIQPGPALAVQEVVFIGNEAFTNDELMAIGLASQPRSSRYAGFISVSDVEADRQRLMAFYEQAGFSEVEVQARAVRVDDDKLRVVFEIQEESRWVVERIDVEGVPAELVPAVLKAMAHCQRGELGQKNQPLVKPESCKGAPFLPGETDPLDVDGRRALNVLVANGFPFAKAELSLKDFLEDGHVVLQLTADVEGAAKTKFEEKSKHHQKLGRGRVRRGTLFVDGNNRTREDVILREFAVASKELRPRDIADGVSRLRKTGLFSRVTLDYIGIEDQRDTIDLRLRVEEKPVITLDVSGSYSTAQNFGLHAELRDRNLLGSMWDLAAKADFGLWIGRYSSIEVPFRWPRVLGFPVDLKLTPSVVYQDLPAASSDLPVNPGVNYANGVWSRDDFRRRQLKVDFNSGVDFKLLPRSNKLILTLAYDVRIDWDDPNGVAYDPFSAESFTSIDGIATLFEPGTDKDPGISPVPFLGPTVQLAYRDLDNVFDPTSGLVLEGNVTAGHYMWLPTTGWLGEMAVLPSARFAGYWTYAGLTLAVNVKGWWGFSYSDDNTFSSILVRNQSLLAAGGDRTVRGFDLDEIGIKELASADVRYDSNNTLDVAGGVANLELRYLLQPNLWLGDLKVAAFVDVSAITDDVGASVSNPGYLFGQDGFDPLSYERTFLWHTSPRFGLGVGLGVRYVLPVGPMSFDFAVSPSRIITEAVQGSLGPEDLLPRPHIQLGYVF